MALAAADLGLGDSQVSFNAVRLDFYLAVEPKEGLFYRSGQDQVWAGIGPGDRRYRAGAA